MTALIIDDERLARAELKRLLSVHPHIQILDEAVNGNDAVEKINDLKPDLIFCDIQMPGKNGFEVLSSLTTHVPEVIFTTAFDEYALKAFEFHAADYLLKPIDPARLAEAVKRLDVDATDEEKEYQPLPPAERTLGLEDQIFVKDGDKCWFVKLANVRLFESLGNYVRIFFDKEKPLILRSLNSLEDRLDPKVFFRANRKHIINLKMVDSIEPYFSGGLLVKLHTGEKIEISRRQAIRFKEMLSL